MYKKNLAYHKHGLLRIKGKRSLRYAIMTIFRVEYVTEIVTSFCWKGHYHLMPILRPVRRVITLFKQFFTALQILDLHKDILLLEGKKSFKCYLRAKQPH